MKNAKKDQTKNVGEHCCYTEQEVEIPVVQQLQDGDQKKDGQTTTTTSTTIKLYGTWTRPTTAAAKKTSTGAASAANDDHDAAAAAATGNNNSSGSGSNSGTNVMVLFVGGSGPLDRDENVGSATAPKLNVCNVLARALATPSADGGGGGGGGSNDRTGMASFRYDKRGAGKSTGNYMHAGVRDLLDDLLAVMDYCCAKTVDGDDDDGVTSTRRLILVGHSEGTILSAMACLERPQLVQALVLICPFVQNLGDVLLRQGRLIDDMIQKAKGCGGWCQRSIARCVLGEAGATGQQAKIIQRIKDSGEAPTIRHLWFHTLPARWFRDHFAMDNAAIYRNVGRSAPTCSTLLLVAGSDAQCDPDDGARIQRLLRNDEDDEGKGDVDRPKQQVVDDDDDGKSQGGGTTHELITIANLSHLLRREDEHKEDEKGFAGYGKQLKMDIDPEVVTTVVEYCRRQQQSILKQQQH